jgi:hypothetical protein
MDILEKVLAQKHKEVADNKGLYPVKLLEKSIFFPSDTISLTDYLLRADMLGGIIAEIKRKSPSKGLINEFVSVEQTSISYMQGGASALSILTDQQFLVVATMTSAPRGSSTFVPFCARILSLMNTRFWKQNRSVLMPFCSLRRHFHRKSSWNLPVLPNHWACRY